MNYTKKFADQNAFKAGQTSTTGNYGSPNVAFIESTSEGRINELYLFEKEDAVVGDIAIYAGGKKLFCKPKNVGKLDLDNYKPFGVVVVPRGLIDTNLRLMSLVNMSCATPTNGSATIGYINGDNYMAWGPQGEVINNEYGEVIGLNDDMDDTDYTYENGYLFSDLFGAWGCNPGSTNNAKIYNPTSGLYTGSYSWTDDNQDHVRTLPYPGANHENDDSVIIPDPITQWDLYITSGYIMSDLDGATNTANIVEKQTATLAPAAAAGNYPAATCCYRFAPLGTDAGTWFLPSIGELGIMYRNLGVINNSLETLPAGKAIKVGTYEEYLQCGNSWDIYGYWLWSSTEYGSNYAWYLDTNDGNVYYGNKSTLGSDNRVRAFAAL